jgi:hypothetical protein
LTNSQPYGIIKSSKGKKENNMIVICENNQPIAVTETLENAQKIVAEIFNYNDVTWEWLCRITNCEQIYTFKEVPKK